MNWIVVCFELMGTISFALSGALTGLRKGMDVFGVCVLGLTTATGGGVIRDLLLGKTPPQTFVTPQNALISLSVSVLTFAVLAKFRDINIHHRAFDLLMLLTDSAGLAIFTVCGVQTAMEAGYSGNLFLVVFVAVMTGVGGGVLRDIFAGDRPYIFVRHIYACASILGAFVCAAVWQFTSSNLSMSLGFLVVLAVRLCSAKYRLSLPRIDAAV